MNTTTPRASALRTVGVIAFIVGPLSLIIATVLQWTTQQPDPTSALFATVGGISVLGPLVWLMGIPAVINLATDRGWVLTAVGGIITAIGLAAGVGHLALFFGVASPGQDDTALANALLFLFLGAFALGPILLTIGLRRARAIAVWVPVAAIVMTVANFVGGVPASIVQLAALVATFAPIVVALLRRRPLAEPASAGRPAVRVSAS
jgi:hypothetical protein